MTEEKYHIEKIRNDFPVLRRMVYKKPLVYLDNAATNHKPVQVLERMQIYYNNENSNIHRGVHFLSREATSAYEASRKTVQSFINAGSSGEIIFTKGTTESINLVAASLGQKILDENSEVLISFMEHHSNIVPWQLACERSGAQLKVCNIKPSGELDLQDFENKLSEKTKIVALAHVSNTLGTINPIQEIIEKAHAAGAYVLIDGAQAVAHIPVDVQALDCDFYCFSAHKIYGPMGVGVLFGKEALLDMMPPYQSGGEMIDSVSFTKTTYNELPFKFEAGTPNVGGVLGFEAAINYLLQTGLHAVARHENDLLEYATKEISQIDDVIIYGNAPQKSGVLTFNIKNIHAYDLGVLMDRFGVAIRTGHLCTQPLTEFFEVPGFARASFAMYNSPQEVDTLIEAIKKSRQMLL
jgi:cysteine desulfurase / selenocysteine lyase